MLKEGILACMRDAIYYLYDDSASGQAVALECMRGAHRQQRGCHLYAFSGPKDVKELELKVDAPSLLELLAFLQYSFGGGTDVDRPLELSLDRLEQKDWAQVRSLSLHPSHAAECC